jgi:hypothetical protein
MRRQWDFKKRKEFCGRALALLFAVAFAISTMISISIAPNIAMAAPAANIIRVTNGSGGETQNGANVLLTADGSIVGANNIGANSMTLSGAATIGMDCTPEVGQNMLE